MKEVSLAYSILNVCPIIEEQEERMCIQMWVDWLFECVVQMHSLQMRGPLYKAGNGTQESSAQTMGRYDCVSMCVQAQHICWHVRAHMLISASIKT